jgi:hypothetical protein
MTTTSPGWIARAFDGGEAVLLGVEHTRGALELQTLVSGELDHAAVGSE